MDKIEFYIDLRSKVRSLVDEEHNITILSQISSLLFNELNDVNWVGFYLIDELDNLYLGPFQGLVACTKIKNGKGVCGTAATFKRIIVVNNVHEFPGHIACDARTNSEIVLPIFVNDQLYGVLDIDSCSLDRFDETDEEELELIAHIISRNLK